MLLWSGWSCHRAKGGEHFGQAASLSQGKHKDGEPHTHI